MWREECGLERAGPALQYDILCYSRMKPYQLTLSASRSARGNPDQEQQDEPVITCDVILLG